MAMLRMTIPNTLLRKVPGPGMRPHTPIRAAHESPPDSGGCRQTHVILRDLGKFPDRGRYIFSAR